MAEGSCLELAWSNASGVAEPWELCSEDVWLWSPGITGQDTPPWVWDYTWGRGWDHSHL